jgi:uncharacterized protein (DUF2164 family)
MSKPSTIDRLEAAFKRLKIDEPKILPKGSKVNVSTVQKEAGFSLGTVTKHKHAKLFKEINDYKDKLAGVKTQEESLEALSPENVLRDKLKTSERRRDKYYHLWQKSDDRLKRQQTIEVQTLQAMFEVLDVHSKDRLIHAGLNPEEKPATKVVQYTDIKKAKSTHPK